MVCGGGGGGSEVGFAAVAPAISRGVREKSELRKVFWTWAVPGWDGTAHLLRAKTGLVQAQCTSQQGFFFGWGGGGAVRLGLKHLSGHFFYDI